MSRLWILLLFFWCYAVTTAKPDTEDSSFNEDKCIPNTSLLNPGEVPLESVPFDEGIYTFDPEDESQQYESFPPWSYGVVSDPPGGFHRNKRSTLSTGSNENKSVSVKNSLNIQKREAHLPEESIQILFPDGTINNILYDISKLDKTDNIQDLNIMLYLLSRYQTLLDHKIKNLFKSPDFEFQLLQECLHPNNNKNKFRTWGGKLSYNINEKLYKKCLELLTQPEENNVQLFDSTLVNLPIKSQNDKRTLDGEFSPNLQPFQSWGGKRNSLEGLDPKRVPFGTWGGKRAAFGPWGGKRAEFGAWGGKRAAFGAWGGKREAFGARGGKRVPEEAIDPIYPDSKLITFNEAKQGLDKKSLLFSQNAPSSLDFFSEESPKDAFNSALPWKTYKDTRLENNLGRDVHSVTNRRSQFNSWGGKRSKDDENKVAEDIEEKRKFGAWAGKRTRDDENKRQEEVEEKRKFNAWAGKRSCDNKNKIAEGIEEKRKFNAWAGKRSIDDENEVPEEKRKFDAWTGKRTRDYENDISEEKKKFSAWAGKRSKDYENDVSEEKRKFGAWAGKRTRDYENKREEEVEEKRKFNAWAGKRSSDDENKIAEGVEAKRNFNAWAGKRSIDDENKIMEEIKEKRKFRAWAGKRSRDYKNDVSKEKIMFSAWAVKRDNENKEVEEIEEKRKFNSWAGKRSRDDENKLEEKIEEKRKFGAWAGKREQLEKLSEPEEENWLFGNTKEGHKTYFNVRGGT